MTDELVAAAKQWQDDGWTLVEGLVPEADIDAVADDIALLYGTDTFADYNKAKGSGDFVAPDGRPSASTSSTGCADFRSVVPAR
jgi:hypothetical protein